MTEVEKSWLYDHTYRTEWVKRCPKSDVKELDRLRCMNSDELKLLKLDEFLGAYIDDRLSGDPYLVDMSLEQLRGVRGSPLMSLCMSHGVTGHARQVNPRRKTKKKTMSRR